MSGPLNRDVTASGVRLRVSEHGSGSPVLLLHGMFMDHSTWDGVVRVLSKSYRTVAPDLPGFGDSEKPPSSRYSYGVPAFAEAVADLYAGLELGRCPVVGHALGGAVALTLASQHPELVSRLVLIDALCYPVPQRLRRRMVTSPVWGTLLFKQLMGKAAFRMLVHRSMLSSRSSAKDGFDHYYQAFNTPAARGSALATMRSTLDTRALVAQTSKVSAPTLVVWGRRDRLYPAGFGQRLSREIRGAGFALLDAGHAPQEEQPDALAAVIETFLNDDRPPQ
jgi:pimeloyl-ACP methyl ester carboxylesterase